MNNELWYSLQQTEPKFYSQELIIDFKDSWLSPNYSLSAFLPCNYSLSFNFSFHTHTCAFNWFEPAKSKRSSDKWKGWPTCDCHILLCRVKYSFWALSPESKSSTDCRTLSPKCLSCSCSAVVLRPLAFIIRLMMMRSRQSKNGVANSTL